MIPIKVLNGSGDSSLMRVEKDGSINTYIIPRPPLEGEQIAFPFSQYLSLDGTETGTSSMLVNGSTTNQDFYIKAKSYDIYVNTLVFTIVDAFATLSNFGNIAPLTNGLDFYYFNQINDKYIIESGLKSNYDMIRLANFEPSFGTGTAAMQLSNVVGASEAYVGVIDFEDIFGLQWGLKLRANSTDSIGFTIKDNLTGLDAMNIKCYGIRV